MKKIIALVLALCMMLALVGCGKQLAEPSEPAQTAEADPTEVPEVPEIAEPEDPAEELPASEEVEDEAKPEELAPGAKSSEVQIYLVKEANGHQYLVNNCGRNADGFSLDESGNIVNKEGAVVILAENVEPFKDITMISFNKNRFEVTLDAREDYVNDNPDIIRVNQYPVTFAVDISTAPLDATNRVLYLSTGNSSIVSLDERVNSKVISAGDHNLRGGEIAVDLDDSGRVRVILTAHHAGEVKIFAQSEAGELVGECVVRVSDGYVAHPIPSPAPTEQINASGDVTMHTHKYTATVIEPTTTEKGYTLYVCEECGYSYKDHFVSKLPTPEADPPAHVHEYVATVVPPTATEQGYTIHTCEGCGDTYRDSYTPKTTG